MSKTETKTEEGGGGEEGGDDEEEEEEEEEEVLVQASAATAESQQQVKHFRRPSKGVFPFSFACLSTDSSSEMTLPMDGGGGGDDSLNARLRDSELQIAQEYERRKLAEKEVTKKDECLVAEVGRLRKALKDKVEEADRLREGLIESPRANQKQHLSCSTPL
jgi:hypothetical protein